MLEDCHTVCMLFSYLAKVTNCQHSIFFLCRNSASDCGAQVQRGTIKDVAHSTCHWLMGLTAVMEW